MPASSGSLIAHVDGASRGNPGPAAYAVIITSSEGVRLASLSEFLGKTTNNFAEYQGLLAALAYAMKHGQRRLRVLTDSELMARQINGMYRVKSADLRPLYDEARRRISQLEAFSITHVRREENRDADRLANQTLDAVRREANSTP